MKKIYTFCFVVVFYNSLFAQSCYKEIDSILFYGTMDNKLIGMTYTPQENDWKRFYLKNWTTGKICMNDSSVIRNQKFKYNSVSDQLIWLNSYNFQPLLIDKQSVQYFVLYPEKTSDSLLFKNVRIKLWFHSDTVNSFLQVLFQGKTSLFVLRRKISYSGNSGFDDSPIYLIQKSDKKYYQCFLKKKSLLNILDEKRDEFSKALTQERNRINSEEELIKAIKIYDNMVY